MRLHQLDIAAFGPFAGQESVDFDDLARSGLFLLNGPTGSGKTSILDAVAYALYGKVPGARSDQTGDLRSHLAEDGVFTEVTLEATIRGRRIRVTRRPQQLRPKKRGDGTTSMAAKATLTELRGDTWVPVADRSADVTDELENLIGLDADQFQQVILLPQGEFARFLRANARDRQELLQAVFDTNRFGAIARWLHEQAKALGNQLSGLDTQLGAAFAECAGTIEVEPPDTTDDDRRRWLEEHTTTLETTYRAALASRDAEDRRVADATDRLAAATALHDLQQRHQQALASRNSIAEDLAQLPTLEIQLDAAQRAEPINVLLGQRSQAETDRTDVARRLAGCTVDLAAIRPDLEGADQAKLGELATTVGNSLVLLRDLAQKERDRLPELREAVERAADGLRQLDKGLAELDDEIARRDGALADDRQSVLDGGEARDLLAPATGDAEVAKKQFEIADQRASLERLYEEQAARLPAVKDAATAAQARYQALFQRRLAGISAELAGALAPGDPCPVCGSVEHPEPATPTDDHVSQEALNRALETQREADDAAATLLGSMEEAKKRIAAMTESIGAAPFDEFHRRHEAAKANVLALRARIDLASAAGVRLGEAEADLNTRRSDRDTLAQQRPTLESNDHIARRDLETLTGELALAAQPFVTVAERVAALDREHAAITDVLAAATELDTLTTRVADLTRQAEERATAAGFAVLAEAERARLNDADRKQLEDRITGLRREDAAIAATLGDPTVVHAAAQPPADLAGAQADLEAARDSAREGSDHVTRVETKRRSLERCQTAFDEAVATGGPLRQQHDTVRNLSRLANGEASVTQAVRMSLVNYVLSAQLQRVADAANTRLHAMTNGRYTLLQTDEANSGHAMGGLGIEVLDLHSTKTRGTRSLSGGESFMASLALALGLADVVAAEAGGISLETLFIDEGFGTLDGDALNSVLDILDGLRSGGRTVGVVSHVAEMKERIPTHLVVEQVDRISRIVQSHSAA